MQGKPLESVSILKSARQPNSAIALVVETSPLGWTEGAGSARLTFRRKRSSPR
jgi:hypothetical protein